MGPLTPGFRSARFGSVAVALLLCLGLPGAGAQQRPHDAHARPAAPVEVGFIRNVPPYADDVSRDGILVDLMKTALAMNGRDLVPRFFPTLQLEFDPLARFPSLDMYVGAQQGPPSGYPSIRFHAFRDVAVSKARRGLALRSVRDLDGLRVLAFAGAHRVLGPEFAAMHEEELSKSPAYSETENRRAQNLAFWRGHVDVILIDRAIFEYYRRQLAGAAAREGGGVDFSERVVFHDIFSTETEVYLVTRREDEARQIRRNLDAMRRDGRYQRIVERYTSGAQGREEVPTR